MTEQAKGIINRLLVANEFFSSKLIEYDEERIENDEETLEVRKESENVRRKNAKCFLLKLEEIEHYSKLGGYIPDMYGVPCHAGDTIQVVGWKEEPVGVLTWMKSHLQFCIVCSDGKRYRLGEFNNGTPRVVLFKKIEAQAASKGVIPLGQGKKG